MAKKDRQNLIEREKNKKGDGTISKVQLYSCYGASALIVILCLMEALRPETQTNGNPAMYYLLAALGVGYSVFITFRNRSAKNKKVSSGPRLK